MKISIRQGVFETNSSSMHALAMQKDFNLDCEQCKEKYKKIIPEHISLKLANIDGETYDDYKCTDKQLIENKILFVYKNMVKRLPLKDDYQYSEYTIGYLNLTQFFSWLSKLGIQYDIVYEPTMFLDETDRPCEYHDMYIYDGFDDDLWEHIYDGSEVSFCNFLFGDGSKIDGYETDCIPYDKYEEIETDFWNNLSNKGKCNTYSYYNG